LNPPLLQDAVGSHIHGSIGGFLLEAKAFYSHRHSRWYIHAEATIKKPLKLQRFEWWSVRGSNLDAISEHVEMKGGQHAISFHPTTYPTTCQGVICYSANLQL
jgi:hypothetical protein